VTLAHACSEVDSAAVDPADVSHRDDVELVDGRARAALGVAEFAAASGRGRAMNTGDLVAFARSALA